MSIKDDQKVRVTTLLTQHEKEALEKKAWRSGRTMSSYLRYLVNEDIGDDYDDD
ncbi:MAG: hypothetical protein JW943_10475 [Deltaproteobacteria bacterium]|nr:hypothetical protein [Deltaproteobacteria bacterium]